MRKLMMLVAVFGLAGSLWAADPVVGTWKLNASKSKIPPTADAMKEQTFVFREVGDRIDLDVKGTQVNGTPVSTKGGRPLQGGLITVQPALAEGTIAVVTVIGPGDAYVTTLQNGKQFQLDHYVVSKDGKTLTVAVKGTDAKGKSFEGLYLFDRQ
jgi:hypothetical protein